jgi:hypothetical protein
LCLSRWYKRKRCHHINLRNRLDRHSLEHHIFRFRWHNHHSYRKLFHNCYIWHHKLHKSFFLNVKLRNDDRYIYILGLDQSWLYKRYSYHLNHNQHIRLDMVYIHKIRHHNVYLGKHNRVLGELCYSYRCVWVCGFVRCVCVWKYLTKFAYVVSV